MTTALILNQNIIEREHTSKCRVLSSVIYAISTLNSIDRDQRQIQVADEREQAVQGRLVNYLPCQQGTARCVQ